MIRSGSPATAAGTSVDWLDACCWRCGSEEAVPDERGRVLCAPCRARLASPDLEADPLGFTRRAYWVAHPLDRCWRCTSRAVDPDDGFGCCPTCLEQLAAR